MKPRIFLLLFALLRVGFSGAQPANNTCAQYTTLCAGNTVHGSNVNSTTEICTGCADGVAAVGTFCYPVNNSVWFAFTTNTTGGAATLTLSNVNCLVAAGMDNELDVAVVSATSPCNNSTYTLINCSGAFSGGTTLNLTGLLPSTTYYVQVDGDQTGTGITLPAECDFDISVSGTAVTPDIQETVSPATCAGNNGQITVNNVAPSINPLQYSINGGAFQPSNTFSGLAQGNHTVVIQDASGCSFNETVTVGLTGGPQDGTPVVNPATGCNTNTGQISINGITGGTPPYSYSLNNGPGQPSNTFSSLPPGTYFVTVTDNAGCSFTYTNIVVSGPNGITNVNVVIVQPTCESPNGTITLNPIGGTPTINYIINGGAPVTTNVFSVAPGTYNFLLFDGAGCTYVITQVIINPPAQTAQPDITITPASVAICQGDEVNFFASAINGGSAPQFNWMVNGISMQNGPSPSFITTALNNGDIVTCELTSNHPCAIQNTVTSNSVTATVLAQINPTVTVIPSSTLVCEGDMVTITSNVTGCPSGSGMYYWTVNGTLLDSSTTNSFSFTAAVNAEVSAEFMCSDPCSNIASSPSQTVNVVQVDVDAGPDFIVGQGGSAELQGSGSGTPVWTPAGSLSNPSSLTPLASPAVTTTYTLTITSNGCSASDNATVVVVPLIEIPNTYTPNGDGINDVWYINRIELFPSCQVTVYDRWGQRVFNSTGYRNENAWDGTYLGARLPAGAYYYVIELNDAAQTDAYLGWVAIVY